MNFIQLIRAGILRLLGEESPAKSLTSLEERVYNYGERLIPGLTHNIDEEIRHRSSYLFFRTLIEKDLASFPHASEGRHISILDLGCGTGHGSYSLASIPGVDITAIDISDESISLAKEKYAAKNISYKVLDIKTLIADMPAYDYIVSRHAIEHVPDGLNLCLSLKWRQRMIINVPYKEPPGNEFHVVTDITSKSFSAYKNTEYFYEDLAGVTYCDELHANLNSILCVSSNESLPRANDQLIFPFPAWEPGELQVLRYRTLNLESRLAQLEARVEAMPSVRIRRKIRQILQ
ncbi:MAG: class I SAM-dependent methyltransferase [Mariprofundaceae bacterium]